MTNFEPIHVSCYSGYKADESPRSFTWNNIRFEITEILDRWYEGYNKPIKSNIVHYYRVKTDLTGTYLIKHDMGTDAWFLIF